MSGSTSEALVAASSACDPPRVLHVLEFAKARGEEIHVLTQQLIEKRGNRRLFQVLPKHLRRRAMSHNPHLLPPNMRRAAKREMARMEDEKKDEGPSVKRRKKTRKLRHAQIKRDHKKRAKKKGWLETHMWHAKRMRMEDYFGFRVAWTPNQKVFRSSYRSANHLCTLQDTSFIRTVQISGERDSIVCLLRQMTIPGRAGVGSQKTKLGSFYGEVVLYKPGMFPLGCIGPARYLWRADSGETSGTGDAVLWLWIHPAMKPEVVSSLCLLCGDETTPGPRVTVLKDILMFELTGPKSHQVLSKVLRQSQQEENSPSRQLLQRMLSLRSPGSVPSHAVLALSEVCDPRYFADRQAQLRKDIGKRLLMQPTFRPQAGAGQRREDKGESAVESSGSGDEDMGEVWEDSGPAEPQEVEVDPLIEVWPSNVSASRLWDDRTRQSVRDRAETDLKINRIRSKFPLRRARDLALAARGFSSETPKLPVLLLQRPSRAEQKGFGAGYTLVLPAGWGMPFWMGMIFAGARPVGVKESGIARLEQGLATFPQDFPDTNGYLSHVQLVASQAARKYTKKPPSKRPNFKKLHIHHPFVPRWDIVTGQEHHDVPDVEMDMDGEGEERNGSASSQPVKTTQEEKTDEVLLHSRSEVVLDPMDVLPYYVLRGSMLDEFVRQEIPCQNRLSRTEAGEPHGHLRAGGLVAVRIRCSQRGLPEPMAHLYLPLLEDVSFSRGKRDPLEEPRGQQDEDSPFRQLIGFVTSTTFSLLEGQGSALGYLSAPGIVECAARCAKSQEGELARRRPSSSHGARIQCLLRNTQSRTYRLVEVDILQHGQ